jgi:tetratricopeptide (TPR) repeat protein
VARINPVKLKQDADKEERAGRFERAVDLLKQIVQENPRDWATVNRIGDLYVKTNNLKAANEQFAKVADFYARDGFYLKAIAVWKKINRNDPSLLEAHLNLGDLYGKQGLAAEAKAAFNVAYDEYVKRGKLREAGDVLRRLAELDPSDLPSRVKLAGLYAREGHQDKAADEYVAIAEELVNKGHRQEALQLLGEGLKIGRRTPRLLSEIAKVHLVQKDFKSALPYLEEARRASPDDRDVALHAAEAYLGVQRAPEARRVLEELLRRHGDDQDARVLLGRVLHAAGQPDEAFEQLRTAVDQLVERRQVDRAVALLQPVSQQEPPHIPTLAKLVELHRLSRNEAMVVQTYSRMVEAYLRQGDMDKAGSILELLVQLEPHNEQHRTKLDWIRKQGVEPAPASWLPELEKGRAPAPVAPGAAPGGAGQPIELSGPLGPEDQEFVDEHLSEGRVFRKYGLVDKARDQFEAIIGRFPDNLEARRELSEIHKERSELDKVAAHQHAIAQILRLKGDTAGAEQAEARAREAVPETVAEAPGPAAGVPPAEPVLLEPEPAALTPEPEPEVDLSVVVESPAPEAEAPELELVDLPEEAREPEPPPEQQFFDEHDLGGEGGEIRGEFLDVEVPPPAPPAPESDFDLSDIPVEPGPGRGLVPQAGPAAEPLSDVPADLQRKLDDVEQYVSLGFVEDAQASLAELGGRYAGHPALLRKLDELGLELAPPESTGSALEPLAGLGEPAHEPGEEEPLQLGENFLDFTAAPSPAAEPAPEPRGSAAGGGGETSFDLAAELGGLFGAQPAVAGGGAGLEGTDLGDEALTDIFREFQKGVDKQLGKEDYETRYNLGIAYKEMGLVDEAIAEFQLAAKDENRLLECASMLGICFLEKGMPKLAVKWFEKGLQAQGRSEAEYQGLRYDLASALEASGEIDRALETFTELYGQNARFRDVEDRVRQLSASR